MGYCDMHCHILPGVDDGSKNMEMSMNMIDIAAKSGITDIILTPHYKVGRCEPPKDSIVRRIQELENAISGKYNDIKLYSGTELMYGEDCIELLEQEKILTMNNTKNLLVEFRPGDSTKYIKESLYKIVCTGYTPILAHIERYNNYIESYYDIDELIEMGCYIQVNADSITGKFGLKIKKFTKMLMKYDLLHLIGTDAHSDSGRIPDISICARYIEKKFDSTYRDDLLINNPKKIFGL